jgi:hypothetical protein
MWRWGNDLITITTHFTCSSVFNIKRHRDGRDDADFRINTLSNSFKIRYMVKKRRQTTSRWL